MLIHFKSTATETVTMFGDVAVRLMQMMGVSGVIPGAIGAADIPAAIGKLRQNLKMMPPMVDEPNDNRYGDDKDREPVVALATRAAPLLNILERAATLNVPVMWERA